VNMLRVTLHSPSVNKTMLSFGEGLRFLRVTVVSSFRLPFTRRCGAPPDAGEAQRLKDKHASLPLIRFIWGQKRNYRCCNNVLCVSHEKWQKMKTFSLCHFEMNI